MKSACPLHLIVNSSVVASRLLFTCCLGDFNSILLEESWVLGVFQTCIDRVKWFSVTCSEKFISSHLISVQSFTKLVLQLLICLVDVCIEHSICHIRWLFLLALTRYSFVNWLFLVMKKIIARCGICCTTIPMWVNSIRVLEEWSLLGIALNVLPTASAPSARHELKTINLSLFMALI